MRNNAFPVPPMKNIHGGPAVNPCTQSPEFGVTPLDMKIILGQKTPIVSGVS